ncbi:MAG: hypothetical protein P8178_01840 [Candidatus Thiodiazotropha sp.]
MTLLDILLSKQMKKRKVATEIGLQSGLFVMCPICHGVTEAKDPSAFRPETEAIVRHMLYFHDPRVRLFGDDLPALLEAIDEVGRSLPYRCNCDSI